MRPARRRYAAAYAQRLRFSLCEDCIPLNLNYLTHFTPPATQVERSSVSFVYRRGVRASPFGKILYSINQKDSLQFSWRKICAIVTLTSVLYHHTLLNIWLNLKIQSGGFLGLRRGSVTFDDEMLPATAQLLVDYLQKYAPEGTG